MDDHEHSVKNGNIANAVFDYVAQRPDELSFKIGDSIEIFEKSDSQWWKGRKSGSKDEPLLFPANFVQMG